MSKPLQTRDNEIERIQIMTGILRDYLMDNEENNHLIEGQEFSDNQLRNFLLLTVDYINTHIPPVSLKVSVRGFPSVAMWLDGASMFALKSAIHKFNRNAFQYNDSGTQVAVEEKAGDYERTLARITSEFRASVQSWKESSNLEQCYGGFSSEFLNLYVIGKRNLTRSL